LVVLTATPEKGYRVAQWTGTDNDASRLNANTLVMWSDYDVVVRFDQPRTIKVSGDPDYRSIQHAIDEAEDGDVVIVPPGVYSPSWADVAHPYITIDKGITLTSENPDDPDGVANTVIHYVFVEVVSVDSQAIIDGLTIREGRMHIFYSSPIVRNCVFVDSYWHGDDGEDGDDIASLPPGPPFDGAPGLAIAGGFMTIVYGSPRLENCTFDNCTTLSVCADPTAVRRARPSAGPCTAATTAILRSRTAVSRTAGR
jgi:hypothetical protein